VSVRWLGEPAPWVIFRDAEARSRDWNGVAVKGETQWRTRRRAPRRRVERFWAA
jgi:hypothetical protein